VTLLPEEEHQGRRFEEKPNCIERHKKPRKEDVSDVVAFGVVRAATPKAAVRKVQVPVQVPVAALLRSHESARTGPRPTYDIESGISEVRFGLYLLKHRLSIFLFSHFIVIYYMQLYDLTLDFTREPPNRKKR